MMTRLKDERGVTLIVALLVTFVVLILSTVVVSQAIHGVQQSGNDRERVQAVDAAESGLDWFFNYFQTTKAADLAAFTTSAPKTVTLGTAPGTAQFSATVTYYDANGAAMSPPFSDVVYPAAALIRSTGTVAGKQPRTMDTYVKLTPVRSGYNMAVLTNSTLNLGNQLTVNGYQTNDGDIYVTCPSGQTCNFVTTNQPTIKGSVYVPFGGATMSNNSGVSQNLYTRDSVTMGTGATVSGNVTSSKGSISVSNPATIGGNATAYGTIASYSQIAGTKSPNTLNIPDPPSQAFPTICWDSVPTLCQGTSTSWGDSNYTSPDAPYYVVTYSDCTQAKNYILTNPTPPSGYGGILVRINTVCALTFDAGGGNGQINETLNGNLAIFTDGSITFANQNNWTGAGSKKKLLLIDNYRSGLNCGSDPGPYDITTSNSTTFTNTDVFFYSPCRVRLYNLNGFTGQVLAGTVEVQNSFTLGFVPVKVPGAGRITSFNEDIAYIREVR